MTLYRPYRYRIAGLTGGDKCQRISLPALAQKAPLSWAASPATWAAREGGDSAAGGEQLPLSRTPSPWHPWPQAVAGLELGTDSLWRAAELSLGAAVGAKPPELWREKGKKRKKGREAPFLTEL